VEVLVIDDDEDIRNTVTEILEHDGHEVSAATSGEEALLRLKSGYRPGLIIIDYLMHRMSGVQFLATCRLDPALQQIPAVLISGFKPDDATVARTGAAAALQKPFSPQELIAVVNRLTPPS
jgi:CheY-like chemotaxis protein